MTEANKLDTAVSKIASVISSARGAREGGHFLSPGEVSDLRRMDVGLPPGAFWRLMVTFVDQHDRATDELERRWALICRGMATMAPRVHDAAMRPGAALAQTNFSTEDRPIRINRLLRAEGEAFEDLFLSVCKFLGSRAEPVDWRSFARLVLRQDDKARKDLARDFYSAHRRPAA